VAISLLFLVLITLLFLLGGSSSTLALDATRAASSVGRSKCKVNVLLGVETNDEGWDIDDLLADAGI